jgi:hypothetical protein
LIIGDLAFLFGVGEITMQIKNEEVVAGVRVLAREMARELNVEELQAVSGGRVIIPVNPGTPMGTGTHGHMPDMDEGDPYL